MLSGNRDTLGTWEYTAYTYVVEHIFLSFLDTLRMLIESWRSLWKDPARTNILTKAQASERWFSSAFTQKTAPKEHLGIAMLKQRDLPSYNENICCQDCHAKKKRIDILRREKVAIECPWFVMPQQGKLSCYSMKKCHAVEKLPHKLFRNLPCCIRRTNMLHIEIVMPI